MISFDEVKKYLPQYLLPERQDELFSELKSFPSNLDQRLYSLQLTSDENIYQGDGVKDILVINFPDSRVKRSPSIIISNTCDIDLSNHRLFSSRVLYAPIFQLGKYKNALFRDHVESGRCDYSAIESHIETLKKQLITQILYLPKGAKLENDSIVFLDRILNLPIETALPNRSRDLKLFKLSNYGYYLFLIKLSIHFTRIRDGVDRVAQ